MMMTVGLGVPGSAPVAGQTSSVVSLSDATSWTGWGASGELRAGASVATARAARVESTTEASFGDILSLRRAARISERTFVLKGDVADEQALPRASMPVRRLELAERIPAPDGELGLLIEPGQGALVVGERRVVLVEDVMRVAAVGDRLGARGVDPDRLLGVEEGALAVAEGGVGDAPVREDVPRVRGSRVEEDGARERRDRRFVLARPAELAPAGDQDIEGGRALRYGDGAKTAPGIRVGE